jgi:hypothetical protein
MADNFRVVDWAVDELQANLNAIDEPWLILHWHFYVSFEQRRVTVVMVKTSPQAVPLPLDFDPRRLRRN